MSIDPRDEFPENAPQSKRDWQDSEEDDDDEEEVDIDDTAEDRELTLELDALAYEPGAELVGTARLKSELVSIAKSVTIRLGWMTMGKGSMDVHFPLDEKYTPSSDQWFNERGEFQFSYTLPASPPSYRGVMIRIEWTARAIVVLKRSTQSKISSEIEFQVGAVAPVMLEE